MTAQNAKLEVYKKQMETARQGIAKKTEELEKLRAEHGDNTTAISKAEKQLNTYKNQLKNAENGIKETEAQLELLTEEVERTNKSIKNFDTNQMKKELKEAGQSLEDLGSNLQSAGQTINSTGNTLIGLSAPITAFAGYASKVSMDFESAMSNVQAISGATGDDLKKLEEKAKEMGASTSKSATDSANAFGYMALAGWDTQQMLAGIGPILRLAEAGNLDLALASDLTTDSLSALGLTAEDTQRYLDTLADAQASSNTTAQALMEAYIEVGGSMRSLNVPLAESTAWLGVLANRGIKSSQAGNSLNSILINLTSGAGQAGEAMMHLGISAFDSEGKFIGIENTLRKVKDATKDLTEEERNMYLSMIGGKTQITTLQALLSGLDEEYVTLRDDVADSTGELEKMAKTMQDNAKGNITKMKSALEGLGIQIGDKLLPHINSLIDKLSGLIEWFGSLDEETQQTIIKMGLFATATGGALKVVGSLTSNIGSAVGTMGKLTKAMSESDKVAKVMSTGIGGASKVLGLLGGNIPLVAGAIGVLGAAVYTYNEYQDAMNSKVTDAVEDMSFLEKAMASLTGTTTYSKSELEEMGLVYSDFNNNISNEFQDSVKAMTLDIHDFGLSLNDINLDGVFSAEESRALITRVDSAMESAKSAIESSQQELQNGLRTAFSVDGTIDENEQSLLDWWDKRKSEELNEVEALRNQINEIEKSAFAEGRTLNGDEIAAIQERYARIKQIELEAQANNNYELEYAQNEFQNRIKTLDAEAAQELLQQRYAQYEEENIAIQTKYDTLIAQAKQGYDSMSEEDKRFADETISRLESSKAEQLAKNQSYWDESYEYAVSTNENLLGTINKYNGEILAKGDINYYERLIQATSHYEELNSVTESGFKTMYNTSTKTWDSIYVSVDEKTKQLTGLYNLNSNEVASMSRENAKSLQSEVREWRNTAEGVQTQNLTMRGAYLDTENNIVAASGRIIGKLGEVTNASGNVEQAILDINGKPLKIGDNTTEVVKKLQNTRKEVDNLDGKKATINVDDGGSIDSFGSKIKNMFSGLFGGGKSYAIGTSNAPQGVHTVNEKGWELIDTPQGKTAFALGSNFNGDTAYLPRGTRVKTNLASTEMMIREIKSEVARQLSKVDFNVDNYIRSGYNNPNTSRLSESRSNNTQTLPSSNNITIVINPTSNNPYEISKEVKRTLIGMGLGL